jgi:hypothetical protein
VDRKVPYSDIITGIDGLDHVAVFSQLRHVDGVLFLEAEPPGLSLTTPFRRRLHAALAPAEH